MGELKDKWGKIEEKWRWNVLIIEMRGFIEREREYFSVEKKVNDAWL